MTESKKKELVSRIVRWACGGGKFRRIMAYAAIVLLLVYYHSIGKKMSAIAAVTAGGKTTTVNEIKKQLSNVQNLYFDDYVFEGEVDNYYQWVLDVAFL